MADILVGRRALLSALVEKAAWRESLHPRVPSHRRGGGRFTRRGGGLPADLGSEIRSQGGATVDPRSASYVSSGTVVATGINSRLVDAERFANDPEWAKQQVLDYLKSNRSHLATNSDQHLGFWHDTANGEIAFDVVEVKDRVTAVRLGRERGEQAVWDLDRAEEVPTGGSGGREDLSVAKRADSDLRGVAEGRLRRGDGEDRRGDRGEGEQAQREDGADRRTRAARRATLSALTNLAVQKSVRHVKTPAGEHHFGQPIGAVIVRDVYVHRPRKPRTGITNTGVHDAQLTPLQPTSDTQAKGLDAWLAEHQITKEALVAHTDSLYTNASPAAQEYGDPWYHNAHDYAAQYADDYNVPLPVAAAVIARLSPRNTWYVPGQLSSADKTRDMDAAGRGNLASARKVFESLAALNVDDTLTITSAEFDKGQKGLGSSAKSFLPDSRRDALVGEIRVGELTPGELAVFHPAFKGGAVLPMNMAPAIQIAIGEKTPDQGLGAEAKIRSFYNNIVSPADSRDVTIDTHQTRAMMKDANFPEDAYGAIAKVHPRYKFYADAVREVADRHGVAPHQVQAVIWEQWRLDNPPAEKRRQAKDLLDRNVPHPKIVSRGKRKGQVVLDDNGQPVMVIDYRVGTHVYTLDVKKLKQQLTLKDEEFD